VLLPCLIESGPSLSDVGLKRRCGTLEEPYVTNLNPLNDLLKLRLAAYEVYRFGGRELADRERAAAILDKFFADLLTTPE
jgi:hypothetical protein